MTEEESRLTAEAIWLLDAQIYAAKESIKQMEEEREQLSGALAEELLKGGAVFIQGGKQVAYIADGIRRVDQDKITDNSERLPPDLRPREVSKTQYPTVSEIEKAAPVLMARGINPADLYKFPGRRWRVMFRDAE